MKYNLDQLIFALSDTVDLIGVDDTLHSKRIGCMAWKCSATLGYDPKRQRNLLYLGLLHDSGFSSTKKRRKLIKKFDWKNAYIHCQKGSKRMNYFEPFEIFGETILHHHTHWQKLKDLKIPEKIKYDANLLYLLDRIDYLGQTTPGPSWISKKDVIRNKINRFRGNFFQADLVDAFMRCSEKEAFWFSLEPLILVDFIEQRKKVKKTKNISFKQLKKYAELVAQIVDDKSPFTAGHSSGVARLAKQLATFAGLDKDICSRLEIAGLFHDIGKLQVPDRVLEQPGPLGGEDLSRMRQHSYSTYRILQRVNGLEDIAGWAANHHEALDGSGYPYRKNGDELDTESRILAIADTFQALAQDRPYRDAYSLKKIISFMQANTQKSRLDPQLVEMLADNMEQCYEIATES